MIGSGFVGKTRFEDRILNIKSVGGGVEQLTLKTEAKHAISESPTPIQ